MKQIILSLAILVIASFSNNSNAQNSKDLAYNYLPSSPGVANSNEGVETRITSIHIKAVRDFSRIHKNVSDAKWFKTDKGFAASFSSQGKYTKVVYDVKGRWVYNIVSYTEAQLDAVIRDQVKSKYYDNTIIGVHQFEFENRTRNEFDNVIVYVVKMLDGQSKPMTITVCDGKMDDITSKK